jgi:hypothetical protein
MPRAGTGRVVQLYDVTRTKVVRSLTPDELNQMAAQGNIGWFTIVRKGKIQTRACVQPVPMQSRTSLRIRSAVGLIKTDVELNGEGAFAAKHGIAGVRKYGLNRWGQTDENIVGNRIDQSMSKVEIWPQVYDDRNVGICAGQVHGARVLAL